MNSDQQHRRPNKDNAVLEDKDEKKQLKPGKDKSLLKEKN
jgi:hypothetical protein